MLWYTDKALVDYIFSDEYLAFDYVQCNEGSPLVLTLPYELNLATAGFIIEEYTVEEYILETS